MTKYIIIQIMAILLGIIGVSLIIIFSNWKIGLGVFLVLYGNNLSLRKFKE